MICHVFKHEDELCYKIRHDINDERHQGISNTLCVKKNDF